MTTDQVSTIACDLTVFTPEDKTRHDVIMARWREAIQSVEELPDGYGFGFEPGMDILLTLAEFVSRERLCCPFFHFEIITEPEGGPVWLRLKGSAPVKMMLDGMITELSSAPA